MLYQWLRVLYGDNGVLTDKSIDNQDETTNVSLAVDSAEDYLYVGQHFPFNNFFIQIAVVNSVAGTLSIEYWNGKEWKAAVDILDGTRTGTVPLAKSGVIQFSPDASFGWNIVGDSKQQNFPTGLETATIYNMYWLRLRWSATPSALCTMKRLAYAFTRSQQIDNLDVQINQFLTSFAAGKTNWDDEIVTASMMVVNDMRRRGIIVHPGQVLRFDDVTLAADWMTLSLIYRNLGPAFLEKLTRAKSEYDSAISVKNWSLDKDGDAFLSRSEITGSVIGLVR